MIHIVIAAILIMGSCSGPVKAKLKGEWKSKDGQTVLKITAKQFTMNIYTSFQGNQPYSKFVVVKIDEHQLKLMYPDSSLMEFSR
jgi:hypothetical protein